MCPSCGHRPSGDGLQVAWLLSEHHLDPKDLEDVAERIQAGDPVRPGRDQLAVARRALRSTLSTDPGLSRAQRVALLMTCLVFTPLPAWVMGWWWFRSRPRAAVQSLALAVPCSVLFFALGCYGFAGGF